MGRLNLFATAAAFLGVAAVAVVSASAQSGSPRPVPTRELQSARALPSSIIGVVSDERGGSVAGAMISAIGTTIATALSDEHGRFVIQKLPPGDYMLRAHLTGYAASRREVVQVGAAVPRVYRLQIRKLDAAAASVPARIMTAGFGGMTTQPDSATAAVEEPAGSDHPHTETAWRLRHIKRSILKDTNESIVTESAETPEIFAGSVFGSFNAASGNVGSLLADLPFTGEVNLLTTGAFGPDGILTDRGLPRGIAYLAIGAPTPAGNWSVRAAMSEADIASWIVAGSFVSRESKLHTYRVGLSYTSQDYQGGNPAALAAAKDGNRSVGEIYGLDRWTLSPGLTFEYGGRYARYDYLGDQGLFSPRAGITLEPVKGTRVSAVLARREIAPGAEEFLASGAEGPWLPPERTFAPFADDHLRVERARYLDVLVEREFGGAYAIGVRRFFQDVDDQLVTFFGLNLPDEPRSVGHYFVASAGTVNADGWGLRLSTSSSRRLRGSIDYTLTRARWIGRPESGTLNPWTEAAIRPDSESIHDITTAIHTDIPETATRVYVLYKLNTAYTRARDILSPGLDGRFDVQVNQALPFSVAGTQWEVLVGLRNLFRDPGDPASVYDELLVVRPPKRVVGGFLVRF